MYTHVTKQSPSQPVIGKLLIAMLIKKSTKNNQEMLRYVHFEDQFGRIMSFPLG